MLCKGIQSRIQMTKEIFMHWLNESGTKRTKEKNIMKCLIWSSRDKIRSFSNVDMDKHG